jgi:hypothetical protein
MKVEEGFLRRAGRAGMALLSHRRVCRPRDPKCRRLRASVGSTEASDGRLARVGVVGPKRARRSAARALL